MLEYYIQISYSNDKGKYQKAYDFLFNKLVPAYGSSGSNLGEEWLPESLRRKGVKIIKRLSLETLN